MELTGWERDTSPYHSGEQELQDRMGRKDHQERMARNIHRPYMPKQHQDFFAQLPLLVAGSVDRHGWPWASVLFGEPGFVATPHERQLSIGGGRIAGDPFWENARTAAPVGFLGIELPTRRRNRVNGVVRENNETLTVDVVQSYGNCPQYIHTRDVSVTRNPEVAFVPQRTNFTTLSPDLIGLIQNADTLFVASHNHQDDKFDTGGVDVSHRGGNSGFVKVDGTTLTVPDYIGNFAFNTLGNFMVNPKAGLLFIDFATGDLVQLTGSVELMWEPDAEIKAFNGAERAWRFHLDHGHVLKAAAPMTWETGVPSPNSLLTGSWTQAAETQQINADIKIWRPFRVTKVIDESNVIRSIYLTPDDGKILLPFKPGQFLTVRVTPNGAEKPMMRTYTITSGPEDSEYRISVKREGVVSQHLHGVLKVGDIIETRAPKGVFWLDTDERRPAVLLAGGVGITPMIAMARAALSNSIARRHHRELTLIHAAKITDQRAFASELGELQQVSQGALRYLSVVSNPTPNEVAGRDFHAVGRITSQLLQSVLPLADYDFYLCGPPAFMQSVYDMLMGLGVNDPRIFTESFGPASLTRVTDMVPMLPSVALAKEAVVNFTKSKFEQTWKTGDGTLLEFAERHGLSPAFGCRSGTCGSCASKLKSGHVSYIDTHTFVPEEGEVLICCSVPAESEVPFELEL